MKLIVMISGHGGDFLALLKAQEAGLFRDVEFQFLISTTPNSMALNEAKKAGIGFQILDVKKIGRKEFDTHLKELLIKLNPDLICLCGFRYLLNKEVVSSFSHRTIKLLILLLLAAFKIEKKRPC